ncbi:MAG: cellulose biosynthesis cyclic di-GMP-binding regulatory protein BcsB [Bacillota bacterium]
MKKIFCRMFTGILMMVLLTSNAVSPLEGAEKNVYNLRLFGDDQLLGNPNNRESYWFEIKPGTLITGNIILDLYYSCSGTLLSQQSFITVSVNGIPVASRRLTAQNGRNTSWRVTIPGSRAHEGINELTISTLQRTVDGLCKDIDNNANWVVLHNTTALHLETYYNEDFRLKYYPLPFLDYYSSQPVKSTIYIPENPRPDEVRTMLQIVSDWGFREQFKQLPVAVKIGNHTKDRGNKLIIGAADRWPDLSGSEKPDGSGLLMLLKPKGSEKGYRLYVSGDGPEGMQKAEEALTSPNIVSQLEELSVAISERPASRPAKLKKGKHGTYTLEDLGYQDIVLPGAFHQRTSVVFRRPLRQKIGSSYVEAHFRHSVALNGKKSALTVYINGRPMASTALDASNEKNGVIRVEIPSDELNKPEWMVEFAFYHDIGEVDCSKRYDEVAWSVIEKETFLHLADGEMEDQPTLAYFPYFGFPGKQAEHRAIMWLSAAPGEEELTLAAIIAARVGQNNRDNVDWQVIMGDISAEEERLRDVPVIIIGQQQDERFASLKGVLPVWPGGQSGYEAVRDLSINPAALEGSAVIEVSDSPWGNVLYTVIGWDKASLEMAGTILAGPGRFEQSDPQVCLVSRNGNILTFKLPELQVKQGIISRIKDYLKVENQNSLLIYALFVGMSVLGIGITLLVSWRRSR